MDNASSPLRALRDTDFLPHAVAIMVVLIWGVTFINSKVLLQHGMTPEEIFVVRFLLAYGGIWWLSTRFQADGVRWGLMAANTAVIAAYAAFCWLGLRHRPVPTA